VLVSQITLHVTDAPSLVPTLEALRLALPLTEGSMFVEDQYQETENKIKERFLDLHYGRVKVTRTATVIVEQHTAAVNYTVEAGPTTVFGETSVEGTKLVDPCSFRVS